MRREAGSARAGFGRGGDDITHSADLRLTREPGLTGSDEAPMAFLCVPTRSSSGKNSYFSAKTRSLRVPNELLGTGALRLLLAVHRSTILSDTGAAAQEISFEQEMEGNIGRGHSPLTLVPARHRARRSLGIVTRGPFRASISTARTPPMGAGEPGKKNLDFATRGSGADWREFWRRRPPRNRRELIL